MCERSDAERLDHLFETLRVRRRRALLAHMHASDEDCFTVDSLATALLEVAEERTEGLRREHLEIELHHRHLPKLDDAGVVEFDARSGDVRYRGGNARFVFDSLEGLAHECTLR